ncbi:hypothetical protein MMC18_005758 [Xylographa bjoerkii]|nr:hypothetical protein [Xylographa bjoerkii]
MQVPLSATPRRPPPRSISTQLHTRGVAAREAPEALVDRPPVRPADVPGHQDPPLRQASAAAASRGEGVDVVDIRAAALQEIGAWHAGEVLDVEDDGRGCKADAEAEEGGVEAAQLRGGGGGTGGEAEGVQGEEGDGHEGRYGGEDDDEEGQADFRVWLVGIRDGRIEERESGGGRAGRVGEATRWWMWNWNYCYTSTRTVLTRHRNAIVPDGVGGTVATEGAW